MIWENNDNSCSQLTELYLYIIICISHVVIVIINNKYVYLIMMFGRPGSLSQNTHLNNI